MKTIKVNEDVIVIDARDHTIGDDLATAVAEKINQTLGYQTMSNQFGERKPGEGLYIGPQERAHIYRMRSIDALIFLGSRQPMSPEETRPIVLKALKQD